MVVTRKCQRCGDELVIETAVEGTTKPVLICAYPMALEERPELNGHVGERIGELFGMIAVPRDVTRPAWVVTQNTTLAQLHDVKLHQVHICQPIHHLPDALREKVLA